MSHQATHIKSLILCYLREDITEAQQAELNAWVAASDSNKAFFENITNNDYLIDALGVYAGIDFKKGRSKPEDDLGLRPGWPAKLVSFCSGNKKYIAAAAVVVICCSLAVIWFSTKESSHQQPAGSMARISKEEAVNYQAVLMLSDSSYYRVDSHATVTLSDKDKTPINIGQNKVEYTPPPGISNTNPVYNTVSTHGTTCTVKLAEGSLITLSGTSSASYTTSFEKNRQVTFVGEAMFHIVPNVSKPFVINVPSPQGEGHTTGVEVTGTRFYLVSYKEDSLVNVTLLDGTLSFFSDGDTVKLEPGETASCTKDGSINKQVLTNAKTTVEQYQRTWRFDAARLDHILKQFSRQWGLAPDFQIPIPLATFSGDIDRTPTTDTAAIQHIANEVGVSIELTGKKMIVRKKK